MRTQLNCASCIIDDLCGALQLVPIEEKIKKEILKESFQFLAREFPTEKIPSQKYPVKLPVFLEPNAR